MAFQCRCAVAQSATNLLIPSQHALQRPAAPAPCPARQRHPHPPAMAPWYLLSAALKPVMSAANSSASASMAGLRTLGVGRKVRSPTRNDWRACRVGAGGVWVRVGHVSARVWANGLEWRGSAGCVRSGRVP